MVGGTGVGRDIGLLKRGSTHVVVGTPGRIEDLVRRGHLVLKHLKVVIVDEADEMLSEGFLPVLQEIFSKMPASTQVGLFSATLPPATLNLTSEFMHDPLSIVLTKEELTLEGIRQYYVDVQREENKLDTICDLFESISVSQCVIFCNSRRKAHWLADTLSAKDFTVSCIHSELGSEERRTIMADFREGKSRILIATDLIARGIDVQGVSVVLNYDVTKNFENYIHRIGRGGRFGRKGVAINFVTASDYTLLKELMAFYNTHIEELPSELEI